MANEAKEDHPRVLYIKLGRGGEWERECLREDQTLRIGFNAWPHDLMQNGDWTALHAKSLFLKS